MTNFLPVFEQHAKHSVLVDSDTNTDLSFSAGDRTCPRVLHVALSLECGGLEQVIVDLVRLSRENGHQAEVLCLERPGELAEPLIRDGVAVHCLNKRPGLRLGIRKDIAKLLQAVQPDVVHTHQIGALFYCGPPARAFGVKALLHTEHGKEYSTRWKTRWLGWFAARHVETFCCVSADTAQHVVQHRIVPRHKIKIIHNGIDVARFEYARSYRDETRAELGIPPHAVVIGTLGRLSDVKRQDVLIEGFASLGERLRDAHLLLVGDGPLRSRLEKLVHDCNLQGRVHFTGYQVDRERYLSAMDVFALTSDSEGTPLALLEAWSMALPVVVTSVGGLPELVEDNVNGRLVPARDSRQLANVLLELIGNDTLRRKLGEGGSEFVRVRFNRCEMAKAYSAIYRESLRA